MKRRTLLLFAILGAAFFAAELPETFSLVRADGVATAVLVEHEHEVGSQRLFYQFVVDGRSHEKRETYFFPETLFLPTFGGSAIEIRYVRGNPGLSAPTGVAGTELALLLLGLAGCLVAAIRPSLFLRGVPRA